MRYVILAFFLAFAAPAQADVPRPDTLADTLNILVEAVRQKGYPKAIIDLEDPRVLSDPDDDGTVFYPHNLHRMLQDTADDEERKTMLHEFVDSLLDATNGSPDFVDENVFPVVRHVGLFETFAEESRPINRAFAGDLMVNYVVDQPTSTQYITPEIMKTHGFDVNSLHDLAMSNLRRKGKELSARSTDAGVFF